MDSSNFTDMLTRKLFYNSLRAMPKPGTEASTHHSPAWLSQLAQMSTSDRPAAPTLEENSHYEKYKEKLAKVKQNRPDVYEAGLNKVYGDKSSKQYTEPAGVRGASMLSQMESSSTSKRQHKQVETPQRHKDLNSIVKLDLLQEKSVAEISQIWSQYYSKKDDVIFATIPIEKYRRLKSKGKECSLFVYPLPREAGYEFLLGQCSEDDWYYTPLIAYQTHGEYAPYSLSIHHFTELADSKGIVLMMGEISSEDLRPELATLLIHQTQLMYGSDENFELVKRMHERPDEFQHMNVIDLCKKAGLF